MKKSLFKCLAYVLIVTLPMAITLCIIATDNKVNSENRFMFTNVEGLPGYVIMKDTKTDKEYFIIDNTYGSSIIRID